MNTIRTDTCTLCEHLHTCRIACRNKQPVACETDGTLKRSYGKSSAHLALVLTPGEEFNIQQIVWKTGRNRNTIVSWIYQQMAAGAVIPLGRRRTGQYAVCKFYRYAPSANEPLPVEEEV